MNTHELIDIFQRVLPCPPDPMPETNSEADYLWRATLFNSSKEIPWRIVQMSPRTQVSRGGFPLEVPQNIVPIITVECDEHGRGVRVR